MTVLNIAPFDATYASGAKFEPCRVVGIRVDGDRDPQFVAIVTDDRGAVYPWLVKETFSAERSPDRIPT